MSADFHYIDTIEQLNDFVTFFETSNVKEIAVDLEVLNTFGNIIILGSFSSILSWICMFDANIYTKGGFFD